MNKKLVIPIAFALFLTACGTDTNESGQSNTASSGGAAASASTSFEHMSEPWQNLAKTAGELGVTYQLNKDDPTGGHFEFRVDKESKLIKDALANAGDTTTRTSGLVFDPDAVGVTSLSETGIDINSDFVRDRVASVLNRVDTKDLYAGYEVDDMPLDGEGIAFAVSLPSEMNGDTLSFNKGHQALQALSADPATTHEYVGQFVISGFDFIPHVNDDMLSPLKSSALSSASEQWKHGVPYTSSNTDNEELIGSTDTGFSYPSSTSDEYPNGASFYSWASPEGKGLTLPNADGNSIVVSENGEYPLRFVPSDLKVERATVEKSPNTGKGVLTLEMGLYATFYDIAFGSSPEEGQKALEANAKEMGVTTDELEEQAVTTYGDKRPLRFNVSFALDENGINQDLTTKNFTTAEFPNVLGNAFEKFTADAKDWATDWLTDPVVKLASSPDVDKVAPLFQGETYTKFFEKGDTALTQSLRDNEKKLAEFYTIGG